MSLSAEDIAYMTAHADESRAPEVILAATLGLFISITGVLLRLLSRRKVGLKMQADDWWIVVALLMDTWMKATTYWSITLGFGKHVIFITDVRSAAILGLVNELLWLFVATPTKISILCLYNRLFQSRSLYRWSLLIGTLVCAYSIAYCFALGFQTVPFRAQWTFEPAWNCDINALIGSVAALDVLTDVMIIASPVPQILKLNLNKQRKTELICVFGVGAIVIVFGIVRTIFTSITPISDPSYNDAKCEIWSLLQPSIGIFSACLPCLRPLLPQRFGGSIAHSKQGPAQYGSKVSKRRVTLDYEMFSQGKDGWRMTDEEIPPRTVAEATEESRRTASPAHGIRVDRDVQITYETNWALSPPLSRVHTGTTELA